MPSKLRNQKPSIDRPFPAVVLQTIQNPLSYSCIARSVSIHTSTALDSCVSVARIANALNVMDWNSETKSQDLPQIWRPISATNDFTSINRIQSTIINRWFVSIVRSICLWQVWQPLRAQTIIHLKSGVQSLRKCGTELCVWCQTRCNLFTKNA